MQLSIVVPYYETPIEDVTALLASIRAQIGIDLHDIEVIIVNDAGTPLPEDVTVSFPPLKIRQITLSVNGGPGVARQAGIDAASGGYIMCCDADDVLHNVCALSCLMDECGTSPDIVVSGWVEEVRTSDGNIYVPHSGDLTWMHGKLLRTAYLREHNIRHSRILRVHEDSYYLSIASAYTDNIRYTDSVTYVWRWHDNSITRADNCRYTYDSVPVYIQAQLAANKIIERVAPGKMQERVAGQIAYIYYLTHTGGWTETEHAADAQTAGETISRGIGPYLHYWDTAPMDVRDRACNDARAAVNGPGYIPGESIDDWIDRIRSWHGNSNN